MWDVASSSVNEAVTLICSFRILVFMWRVLLNYGHLFVLWSLFVFCLIAMILVALDFL